MIDAENLAHSWLAAKFTTARVVTETPGSIVGPTIRAVRISGGNKFVLDRAVLDVDCYDLTRASARTLAEQVRDAFCFLLPGTNHVTAVETLSGPAWRPWENTSVRRFGATYQLYIR
jgi:hypothetical protein